MNNISLFAEKKYLDLKNVIPVDICKIITKYALLKEENEFTPELGNTAQVENAHSVYSDTLMETMLHFLLPHVEKNTGLSLCSTYTYYRVYRPGMMLDRHRDRPSCEISTTVCFGFNYINTDPEYRWGMYVEPEILISQDPGDLIIYRGCEVDHWRDSFVAGSGSYQVQGFLHYIDKNGPFYPEYAYDKRPNLGYRIDKMHK
jgi:hypothetical protein|tara:strand:+ start:66 stop:671 length:606 start_codon:yes stop_codon:yes gene_type:complete